MRCRRNRNRPVDEERPLAEALRTLQVIQERHQRDRAFVLENVAILQRMEERARRARLH